MKLVREAIDFKSVFKPLSKEQILDELKKLSKKELSEKLFQQVWNNKSIKIVKLLIDSGADVNIKQDINKVTPLMLASSKSITKLLIASGANINDKDYRGWTPLMWASSQGFKNKVEILINAGADVNIKSIDDNSNALALLLDKSFSHSHSSFYMDKCKIIMKMLIDAGIDVNSKDKGDGTPLYTAIMVGDIEIIKILLDAGADVNIRNNQNESPLKVASVWWGNDPIKKLLYSYKNKKSNDRTIN